MLKQWVFKRDWWSQMAGDYGRVCLTIISFGGIMWCNGQQAKIAGYSLWVGFVLN